MQPISSEFSVGINLLHGLFRPYLIYFKDTIKVFIYRSTWSQIGGKKIFAVLIASNILETVIVPYNSPDIENPKKFFVDMTESIGLPPDWNLDKDVYDATFWQSREIDSLIMSWIPYFSNCDTQDERIIVYDFFEYDQSCTLPKDINVVNPIPSTGINPDADICDFKFTCWYDEPLT